MRSEDDIEHDGPFRVVDLRDLPSEPLEVACERVLLRHHRFVQPTKHQHRECVDQKHALYGVQSFILEADQHARLYPTQRDPVAQLDLALNGRPLLRVEEEADQLL